MQAGSLIDSSALLVGKAGNITITVGNFPTIAAGGHAHDGAGSRCWRTAPKDSAGAIEIKAGLAMDVDGLVRSFGGVSRAIGGQSAAGRRADHAEVGLLSW